MAKKTKHPITKWREAKDDMAKGGTHDRALALQKSEREVHAYRRRNIRLVAA